VTTVRSRVPPLGAIALLAVLAASVAVGAYVYHARTPDLALEARLQKSFSPGVAGKGGKGEIDYYVRYDEPHATVELVGRDKALVRTIGDDIPLQANKRMTYEWDGLDDDGEPALPGRYRLRVILPGVDRDMIFPRRIRLEPAAFEPESRDQK
jgi:flagellar hook assembly protein FlgD